jgi:hypothetical protein
VRGEDILQESLFTTVQLEAFVPADHPLRSTTTAPHYEIFSWNAWRLQCHTLFLAGASAASFQEVCITAVSTLLIFKIS